MPGRPRPLQTESAGSDCMGTRPEAGSARRDLASRLFYAYVDLYCNMLTATIGSRTLELNVIEIHGEPYLSAAEACQLLGVKPATLYAYVSRGVLKSYRQGIKRARLYRRGDVQRVLHLRPSRGTRPLPHAADWMGDP